MKHSNKRHSRLGFTLIELVVAGTIAAMVLMAVTFALAQLSKTRNIARERVEAFQRASMSIEALRRDIAAMIRTDDLFDTRFLLTTREASARTGGHERSDLLMFNISLRPLRPIDYQGEGREYETHYRVEDDELGSALWRRRDMAPDERPDGGGLAEPIADGVVGFLVEASDGDGGWRTEWDSDVDGVPKLVRVTVTATGIPVGANIIIADLRDRRRRHHPDVHCPCRFRRVRRHSCLEHHPCLNRHLDHARRLLACHQLHQRGSVFRHRRHRRHQHSRRRRYHQCRRPLRPQCLQPAFRSLVDLPPALDLASAQSVDQWQPRCVDQHQG